MSHGEEYISVLTPDIRHIPTTPEHCQSLSAVTGREGGREGKGGGLEVGGGGWHNMCSTHSVEFPDGTSNSGHLSRAVFRSTVAWSSH